MTKTPAPANTKAAPAELVTITYSSWSDGELRADGPDLPAEATLRDQLNTPARNRWGLPPAPVDALPLSLCRALWRWDRAADLAADAAERARLLAEDTTRDDDARRADMLATIAGQTAHAVDDLARDRAALATAATDLATMAELVGELARTGVHYLTGSGNGAVGLVDWLRDTTGTDVAAYLETLAKAAEQRAAIMARVYRVAGWWTCAAGRPQAAVVPELPALPASRLADVRTDGVRNVTSVSFSLASVVASERASLGPIAAG